MAALRIFEFNQSEVELFNAWWFVDPYKDKALPMATLEQLEDCKSFMDNVCRNMEHRPGAYGAGVRRLCAFGLQLDDATPSLEETKDAACELEHTFEMAIAQNRQIHLGVAAMMVLPFYRMAEHRTYRKISTFDPDLSGA